MQKPLIIFVDGIWRRPGRFKHWIAALAHRGIDAIEYGYNSSGLVPIEQIGAELSNRIRAEDRPVSVLGFSMGGLIIRSAHAIDEKLPIRRAAFLNTPHAGTWMAWTLPLPAVKQMRPNSALLQQLDRIEWKIPTICVHCPGDAMVLPGTRARFSHASESISSPVPAHMWPVFSPSIRRR